MECSRWWAWEWELGHGSVGWDWELCSDALLALNVRALVPPPFLSCNFKAIQV
jgi:hypothetical protein